MFSFLMSLFMCDKNFSSLRRFLILGLTSCRNGDAFLIEAGVIPLLLRSLSLASFRRFGSDLFPSLSLFNTPRFPSRKLFHPKFLKCGNLVYANSRDLTWLVWAAWLDRQALHHIRQELCPFLAINLHQDPEGSFRKQNIQSSIKIKYHSSTSISELSGAFSSLTSPLVMRKLFISWFLKSSIKFRWKRMLSKDVAGRISIETVQWKI